MNVVEIDPIADARWMTFLESAPGALPFHHPAWLTVLSDTYGYAPACLAAIEGDAVVGLLPLMEVRSWLTGNRAVCLPFSDRCSALANNDSALAALLSGSEELGTRRKWRYVEIKQSIAGHEPVIGAHYKLHQTVLSRDPEALFRTFKKSQTQQPIAAAKKLGVTVERRTDSKALDAFIYLNALTRRKHGVPPQPDSFFANIARTIFNAGLGFIGVATMESRIVATALFLHWRKTIIYKYSASDDVGRSAKASHAVIWDAMRWGCEHGFELFDLGRTDLTNPGLLQFKRGWGSQESDLTYMRLGGGVDHSSGSSGILERLKPFNSRIPLPILKLVGRSIYAHLG